MDSPGRSHNLVPVLNLANAGPDSARGSGPSSQSARYKTTRIENSAASSSGLFKGLDLYAAEQISSSRKCPFRSGSSYSIT